MSSSSEDECISSKQPITSTDSLYRRLVEQQREMQNDLNKLTNLIRCSSTNQKSEKYEASEKKQVTFKQFESKLNEYGDSLVGSVHGKGSMLQVRKNPQKSHFDDPFILDGNEISNDVSTNNAQENRSNFNVTGKYIRIEADPESGEPILSIFDEAGQSQVSCAYLTKDFKLDIDFKLRENKTAIEKDCHNDLENKQEAKGESNPDKKTCITNQTENCTAVTSNDPGMNICPNWVIWRIDDYPTVECKNDGEWCGAFYLGQPGYRFQAKLEFTDYLVGIYIRLYCGDYDSCLHWPFYKDIYFSILDQTGSGNHIVRVLRPYVNDADEQGIWVKPDMKQVVNQIGWGLPDFGLRSLIQANIKKPSSYLRNGTLYIQISLGLLPSKNDIL